MRKLLTLVAFWLLLVQSIAAQGATVYLPLIVKNGDCMATLAKLEISDGTTTVNLLTGTGQTGFSLRNWDPAVIQPKGGGVFQDSPLAAGRRLVYAVDATAIEDMTIDLNDYDQDGLIAQAQDLMRLLLKARAYQSTEFQDEPVWIRARSSCETNDRYALIINWSIPQLSNPYAQPFVSASEISTMDEISLQLERGHWRANEPGVGECVEVSNSQMWDYGFSITQEASAPPGQAVLSFTQHGGSGALYAGVVNESRIMKSTDGGDTWANNLTVAPVPVSVHKLYTLANNYILAGGFFGLGGTRALVRTTNDGTSWSDVSHANMAGIRGIVQTGSGAVLAVGLSTSSGGSVWRSTDNGGSWTQVVADLVSVYTFMDVVIAPNGDILTVGERGIAYKSSDDGQNWSISTPIPSIAAGFFVTRLIALSDRILAITDMSTGAIYQSTDNGASWSLAYTKPGTYLFNITSDSSDNVYSLTGSQPMYLIKSTNKGQSWQNIATVISQNSGSYFRYGLYHVPSSDRLLIGADDPGFASGYIFRTSPTALTTLGRSATCDNEVIVGNRNSTPNLTHIFRDNGGAFSSIYPLGNVTTTLFAAPSVNDAVYFGVQNLSGVTRPFSGLAFDVGTVGSGNYILVWEYWSGAAWSTLTTQDNTNSFRNSGVNTVSWAQPSNWASTTVNGIAGLWIRVRIATLTGAMTSPTQVNRDIYATNQALLDVALTEVLGDIPAITQLKIYNLGDADGPGGNAPNLQENRVVAGLKSIDTSDDAFRAYINLADLQYTPGITINLGTNTTFATDIQSPSGRRVVYNPGGVESMASRATISLGPTVARDFYGIFHAFLRARRTAGTATDLSVRLQVATGSGGISFTTQSKQLQTTTAFEVLDFGEITLPVSGSFKSSDLADITEIRIQASAASGTPDLYLYDLILIPVDEWAIDAVDATNSNVSDVGRSGGIAKLLDVDSITDPRIDIKTLVRTADVGGLITAEYNPITNGPAILQANATQRLWFFAMQTSATGASYSWLAPPEIVHSVQIFKNEGYLGQRGAR